MPNAFARLPGEAYVRGLTPMYAIAAGFFVLSYLERSLAMALFSVGYLGLALLANLYDIENRVRVSDDSRLVNPLVVAVYLLIGGIAFAVVHRFRGRRA